MKSTKLATREVNFFLSDIVIYNIRASTLLIKIVKIKMVATMEDQKKALALKLYQISGELKI